MPALWIVEQFEIAEQILAGFLSCFVDLPSDPLGLEGREEAFGDKMETVPPIEADRPMRGGVALNLPGFQSRRKLPLDKGLERVSKKYFPTIFCTAC